MFYDEFDDERHTSIWFEEGMCEYLSQKWTLAAEVYDQKRAMDALLIAHFTPYYGMFSLDDFGINSYQTPSLAAIMLNYWRSAAAVHHLVEARYHGDVHRVFAEYVAWHNGGRQQPLTQFFGVEQF
ncbi:hypothetical protein [Caryophanon tenue]|uniref:Uncharacterized protein n=1 Tax=Caryophanon tenue TaxID=33978 RepID=A0A1C0YHP4_9BACL|nr:hypothetical protein [Caryophanon tenue]OCS86677.1 hypothetical protein A6M13_12760 [Caryophanon tenue]